MERSVNPVCQLDHRVVAEKARRARCTPQDSVATLLKEFSSMDSDPVVQLPAAFIRAVPCFRCHESCLVGLPEWAIERDIHCRGCGGPFERTTLSPERHGQLSFRASEALLDLPLAQIGLGPGIHVRVYGKKEEIVVALIGGVDSLVEMVGGDSLVEHS